MAGIEREHAGHRAQRQILRAETCQRLAQRTVDLRKTEAGLERRRDPGREMFGRRGIVTQDVVGAVRPELAAGFRVDQPDGQVRLGACASDRPSKMIAGRHRVGDDGDTCAAECGDEIVGDIGGQRQIFGRGLDQPERDRRPVPRRHEQRRHRAERVRESRLPLQRLRRRLAVASAVGDREPAEMRKTAAQRYVHDLEARAALQQFAAGAFEPDLPQHGARRPAKKAEELTLQGPGGNTGYGGELG